MIAIYQVKASPEGTAIRMWEWKGADLPFEVVVMVLLLPLGTRLYLHKYATGKESVK